MSSQILCHAIFVSGVWFGIGVAVDEIISVVLFVSSLVWVPAYSVDTNVCVANDTERVSGDKNDDNNGDKDDDNNGDKWTDVIEVGISFDGSDKVADGDTSDVRSKSTNGVWVKLIICIADIKNKIIIIIYMQLDV